jgi:hypothetical protein
MPAYILSNLDYSSEDAINYQHKSMAMGAVLWYEESKYTRPGTDVMCAAAAGYIYETCRACVGAGRLAAGSA